MKKMIMSLVAIAAACSLQAASVSWGFTSDSIMDAADSDYLAGGTAFLYLGTISIANQAFVGLDSATLLASGGQNESFTFGSDGEIVSLAGLASDAKNQAYTLILVDQDGISDLSSYVGNAIVASGLSNRGSDPMSGDTWAIMENSTAFSGADWSTIQSVPEPTSGLLLLLGMAGLALRRKQA